MSRVKLTEYKAKQLLFGELGKTYAGTAVYKDGVSYHFSSPLSGLSPKKKYAVKVDQGIKGRMKKGLVALNVKKSDLQNVCNLFAQKGFTRFLVEEMLPHEPSQEKYISLERTRDGILVRFASQGGIDIESNKDKVRTVVIAYNTPLSILKDLGLKVEEFEAMRELFEKNYISFMEINPMVITNTGMQALDLAVEVDSTAEFFVKNGWTAQDVVAEQTKSEEEQKVKELNSKSQAALSFTLLNQDGSIWCLLSGGGASITLADEIYNLGYGQELGNYGEYSGNPNQEETYLYTTYVLQSMLKSKNKKLVLIIGGGVANFTDIRTTFKGVLQALEEYKTLLKKRNVKLYVRRGGPHQEEGLAIIEKWSRENNLYGHVSGPELPLHEIVRLAVKILPKKK